METLRFPGEPRESERAGAPERNRPRQAFAQQGTPERYRGPRPGKHELTAGQAGAQTRLQHSFKKGVRGRGMTQRVDSRQGKPAAASGSTRAKLSIRTQLAGSRRALLPKLVEEDFQNFCLPGEELMRRGEHMRARARKREECIRLS